MTSNGKICSWFLCFCSTSCPDSQQQQGRQSHQQQQQKQRQQKQPKQELETGEEMELFVPNLR